MRDDHDDERATREWSDEGREHGVFAGCILAMTTTLLIGFAIAYLLALGG